MRTAKGSNATNHNAYQRFGDARGEELPVEDAGQLSQRPTIDVLPDDVLIEVFDLYLYGGQDIWRQLDVWCRLVQVCQRWREVVFASPRRLNLRLLCTSRSPVKKLLDIWPALPIVIKSIDTELGPRGFANIDAALEHKDRVCEIDISISSPLFNTFASIKEPLPLLTYLHLWSCDSRLSTLPDSFLGGSAPCLRNLSLGGITFPGLPKLLLSAHHLVHLALLMVDSGYISPEAMVTCLTSLTSLESLVLHVRSPGSRPDQTNQHLHPLILTVLPSLAILSFKGDSEYLEDVVARIDMPLLNEIKITFFNQLIFDTPLLRSFISRTEAFKAFRKVELTIYSECVNVILLPGRWTDKGVLHLGLSFEQSGEQPSSLARACNSILPRIPTLESLDIYEHQHGPRWQDDIEVTQWLELFRPFITAESLWLNKRIARRVAPALQELAEERVTEVLPALQNVFVQVPVPQAIARFIAARQLPGHPVAFHQYRYGRDSDRMYDIGLL